MDFKALNLSDGSVDRYKNANFHVNHLTQLGMINITFKCHKKNICKKVHNFHHCLTWFLAPFFVLSPNFHMLV